MSAPRRDPPESPEAPDPPGAPAPRSPSKSPGPPAGRRANDRAGQSRHDPSHGPAGGGSGGVAEATDRVDAASVALFERAIAAGELAIFPADTVYGIAAAPDDAAAVARLNAVKGRDPAQPSGVMYFAVDRAEPLLAPLGPRTRAACAALLPGPVTLVLPNPARRHPLVCGATPERIGLRVPALAGALAPLAAVSTPVVQSSANLHGGADPRRLVDVPAELRAAAAVALDGGELPGTASTVIDLTGYERGGDAVVLREGALAVAELRRLLS